MKKKLTVPAKLKKLVIDSLRQHSWNMGVSHYHGDIFYMDADKEVDRGDDQRVMADMTTDIRYKKCRLRIYPVLIEEWKERGDSFVDAVIAHEVAHVLTEPLHVLALSVFKSEEEVANERETLTELISRISLKVNK